MPKKIQKSLQEYISKMKKTHQHIHFTSHSFSSSKSWILSGCKHPKTLSFAVNQSRKPVPDAPGGEHSGDAATLSDVDRFLFENFKSLYLEDQESSNNNGRNRPIYDQEPERKTGTEPVMFESPRFVNPPPDLCGSHRFFVAPGSSGSLMEEARSSLTATSDENSGGSSSTATRESNSDGEKEVRLPDQCIAVLTQSTSPVEDFRRSMQDVIDAKLEHEDEKIDWDYMEELLFCYLNMNDKKSYKYILSAFVDQIVVLRKRSDEKAAAKPRNFGRSRRRNRGSVRRDSD